MIETDRCRIAKEIVHDIERKTNDKEGEIREVMREEILEEACHGEEVCLWDIYFMIGTHATTKESDIKNIIKRIKLEIEEYGIPKLNLKVINYRVDKAPETEILFKKPYWFITFGIHASARISRYEIKNLTKDIAKRIRKFEKVKDIDYWSHIWYLD